MKVAVLGLGRQDRPPPKEPMLCQSSAWRSAEPRSLSLNSFQGGRSINELAFDSVFPERFRTVEPNEYLMGADRRSQSVRPEIQGDGFKHSIEQNRSPELLVVTAKA